VRDTEHEHTVLRAVTDEIVSTLCAMTGSEYVDRYASEVKKARGGRPADGAQAAAAGTAGTGGTAEESSTI